MKTREMVYYEEQLSLIDAKNEYAPIIRITDGKGSSTKCMDINKDSAKILVVWLQNNFILK